MAALVVERGNEKGVRLALPDQDGVYAVGRANQCHLILTDFLISRQHFQIEKNGMLFTIADLQSHNGTFLNGIRLAAEAMLQGGDLIRVGETLLSFLLDAEKNEGALTGRRIAGYQLLSRIGVGGMGEVYKAIQVSLGRQVALKVLSPELTRDRTFVTRFLSEARSAARLNHPNVIGVHEVGEENGIYYLSMEHVGGGSVQDLLTGAKKLDPLRATELVMQAARALEYAEKAGIVHRDVKPDNLMLTEMGDVRLADLGIAKRLNPDGKADQAEGVFGSPHYMAPEQARGFNLDHRADLYSLGVTYYRMLSGKLPFTGKDAREIMEKQVFETAEPLKRVEPHLAPIIYRIVERLMRKRPEQRYASATELFPDLETALQQIRAGVRDDGPSASRSSGSRPRLAVRTPPAKRKGFFRRLFS